MLPVNIVSYIVAGVAVFCGLFGFEVRSWQAKAEKAAAERTFYAQREALQQQMDTKSAEYEALRKKSEQDHEQAAAALQAAFSSFKVDPHCAPPPTVRGVLIDAIKRASAAPGESGK